MITRPLVRRHHTSLRLALIGFSILTPVSAFAQALPTGGAYVAGAGTIASAGSRTTITQSSARGIINWQGFSIGAGGTVQFNNGSGATLNRVTGSQMSSIQGRLGATGSVFLINPNGVVIGPKGTVVAGGSFVASTRDTPDGTFMKGGAVTLSGTSSGTVRNEGRITSTGGNVVLVGKSVTNSGAIEAAGGTVALAAGDKVVLSEAGGPDGIYVVADVKARGDATNTGRITAAAATLASAGGNVYALAGNRRGLIQATGTKTIDGQVWLTAPNGAVTVDGTTVAAANADGSGGIVGAHGDTVTVGGKATLSASATRSGAGGGRVLVGTDAPGGVNLARHTAIAQGATLAATGKGGGKGGLIETSAHSLALGKASVDAGKGGTWLLDPDDLTIDAPAARTINAALNSGTDVTEQTSAGAASNISGGGTSASGNGDIFVTAPLMWNSSASLTLSAWRNVTINAAITVAGNGTLNILTNTQGATVNPGGLTFAGGNVAFTDTTGGTLNINGQPYTLLRNASDLTSVQYNGYYALAGSLDATPLGTLTSSPIPSFSGTFEGLGNTISNLTIHDSSGSNIAPFGQIDPSGIVENVGLVGVSVTGGTDGSNLGGLVGVNYGAVSGAYTTGSVNGRGSDIGGLVGMNGQRPGSTPGTITNSYSAASVTGVSNWGPAVGGLVGMNEAAISRSAASGSVSTISSSSPRNAGGLVGYNVGSITDAYASGAVTSGDIVGGLVGSNTTLTILQTTMRGQITNAYATGAVTGSTNVGQIAGQNTTTITNAYFDTNTSSATPGVGTGSSSGITGLTTVQLAGALPAAFNSAIWGNLNNQTTPYLLGVSANQQVHFGTGAPFPTTTPVWLIFTPAGLQNVNASSSASYALANSLDLSGISNFRPLAVSGFTGTFDGRGNTISNLTINDSTDRNVGLFGQLAQTGVVRNIGLLGGSVSSNGDNALVGSLVGTNIGQITNAYATGSVSATNSNNYVGGFVGYNDGSITNAYATGSVSATNSNNYVGGFVGYNDGSITNAYATGSVSATNSNNTVGGFVGYNDGSITNAYATGSVSATNSNNYVGGFVGYNDGSITNAYATGSVSATSSSWVGGFVGENDGIITNAYATGTVSATNSNNTVGGFVGEDDDQITYAYFDTDTSGTSNATGGAFSSISITGLTTAQWASEGPTVAGSPNSFSTPGDWVSGSPYPVLKALPYVVITGQGSQVYGQSTATVVFTSIKDQNGLDVSGKVDTTALTWGGTNLSTTSSVGNSAPLIIVHGSIPGYQTIYTGTDTVIKAALTITALNQSSVYGQTPVLDTTKFTSTGLVNGDTVTGVTLTTPATNTSPVGGYAITPSAAQGSGLTNYIVTYHTGTLTIDPAALSITALNQSSVYGQTPALDTTKFTSTGLLNGDTVTGATLTTPATNTSPVGGGYTIAPSAAQGSGLTNYIVTYHTGTLTIDPAALSITALNQSSVYGQTPALDTTKFTSTGLLNGDTVTGATLTTSATNTSPVGGGYTIAPSAAQGSGLTNYIVTYHTGTLTIDPAALSITALNQSSVYGQTPALDTTKFTSTGLLNGDTVTGATLTTSATNTSPVGGGYAIAPSAAQGSGLTNYIVTYHTGTLTIDPAALSITALNQSSVYGQTPALDTTKFTSTGLLNGDTVTGATLTTSATNTSPVGGGYTIAPSAAQGSGLTNYIVTYHTGTLTIDPAALSITALNQSSVYGQTPALDTTKFTSTGLLNGDTVTGATLTTSATNTSPVGGGYTIAPSAAQGSGLTNYIVTYHTGTLTIDPAALSITALNQSSVYGQTPALDTTKFTSTGLLNGDTVTGATLTTSATNTSPVGGGYTIAPSAAQGSGLTNYIVTYHTGTLTIDPAALSITALNQSSVYGQTPALDTTKFTSTGLLNGDTVTGATLTTPATNTSPVGGGYTIAPSAAQGSGLTNYIVTYHTGTLTIDPAALTITALNQSSVYGQTPALGATQVSATGLLNGDTVTGATLTTPASNTSPVGGYAITPSAAQGSGLTNYAVTYQPGTLTIDPAALTITALNQSSVYGQTPALGATQVSATGLLNDDTVTGATLTTPASHTSPVGGYAITPSAAQGSGLTNYAVTYQSGTLTIDPAALTITALNQSSVYGQTPALGATQVSATGLLNGDTVTGATLTTPATNTSPVGGGYPITPSAAQGSGLTNYTVTYQPGTLTIDPAALTITALNQSSIYGQTPALGATQVSATGLLNGDTVTGATLTTPATNTSPVGGGYPITPSAAQGSGLTNYAVTYQPGTLTIDPAALTITALNQSSIYGQTPALGATQVSATGLLNGDTVTGATLTTPASNTSPVGGYAITPSAAQGSGLTNYTVTYQPGTLTIDPAALSITALNQSSIYGQTPALGATQVSATGLLNGDTVTGATLTTQASHTSPVGGYAITPSAAQGSGLTNYAVTYQPGILTIDPAALTVTALNQSSVYGQTPALGATQVSATGLLNGDTVTGATLTTPATNTSPVGGYAITPSAAQGSGLTNYAVTYQPGILTIDPAALTVTALNQSSVYGQTPALGATQVSATGLLNGDTVTGATLTTQATNTSPVGGYAITPSAAQGSGLTNYIVTYQPGTLTIDPAALTITALNQSSVYGQTPALGATQVSATGLLNGDTVTGATLTTQASNTSPVGGYVITPSAAQGSGLTNYAVTYQPGTLTIDPAALTITALNQSSVYGQTPALGATQVSATGLLNGDTVTGATLTTPASNTSPVGGYAITPSAAQGSGLTNYAVTYQPGTLTISSPASISPPIFWPVLILSGNSSPMPIPAAATVPTPVSVSTSTASAGTGSDTNTPSTSNANTDIISSTPRRLTILSGNPDAMLGAGASSGGQLIIRPLPYSNSFGNAN